MKKWSQIQGGKEIMLNVNGVVRLAGDPELKVHEGNTFLNIRGASRKNRPAKEGQADADFVNLVFFNKAAETVAKYCAKGSQLYISGTLQTRSYKSTTTGNNVTVTEIVVNNFEFVGSKATGSATATATAAAPAATMETTAAADVAGFMDDLDEELPFN